MTEQHEILCEKLKQLGYSQNNRMRIYGSDFELTSDPIVMTDQLVFVDAVEKKSGHARRVGIPLSILKVAGRTAA